MVEDLSKPLATARPGQFDKANVRRFFWVNNRRLVYDAQDAAIVGATAGASSRSTWTGVAFPSADRRPVRLSIRRTPQHHQVPNPADDVLFHSTLPGDTDDVVVADTRSLQSDPYNEVTFGWFG